MCEHDSNPRCGEAPASAALLAGGRSRRFGGDKARVVVGGEALLLGNRRRMAEVFDPVWVVGPPAQRYADWGVACVPDQTPGAGPMGGVVTALRRRLEVVGEGVCVVVAVDFLLGKPGAVGVAAQLAAGVGTRLAAAPRSAAGWQPVFAAYHTRALAPLEAAWAAGERSLQRWLGGVSRAGGLVESALPVPPSFNTPGELADLGHGA